MFFKVRVFFFLIFISSQMSVLAETAIHNCTGLSGRVVFPVQRINMTVVSGATQLSIRHIYRTARVSAINITPLTSGTEEVSVIESAVRNWASNSLIINSEDIAGPNSRESFTYVDDNGQTFSGAMVYERTQGYESFIGVSDIRTTSSGTLVSGTNTTVNEYVISSVKPFAGGVFTVTPNPYITFINGRNISFPVKNKNRISKFNLSLFITFDNWVKGFTSGVQNFNAQNSVVYELTGTCTYQAPVLSWSIVPDGINFNNVALGSPSALSTFTIQQNPGGGLADGSFRADFSVIDGNKQHIAIGDSYATVEFQDASGDVFFLETGQEYKLTNENQKMDVMLYPVGKQLGLQTATVNFTFTYN